MDKTNTVVSTQDGLLLYMIDKIDEIVDWINEYEEKERKRRLEDPNGPPFYT